MTMGERIKQLRKDHDMSQEMLGNMLGVQKSAILKYEKGEVENIPRESILIMASKFNVTPEYILAFSDDEKAGYMSENMVETCLVSKYGADAFKLLDRFASMTARNKDKLLELSEDISKAEKYDSAAQMFK